MITPKLKFKFDPKRDFEVAWSFYNQPKYSGVNFWQKGALRYHDNLVAIEKSQNKKAYLSNYVLSLHKKHHKEFDHQKKEIAALYKKKERKFFYETGKIFKNYPWPKGKYVAYLSIFDFCPRFVNDKTFFVFMYDNVLFTIFHEMLHFIFYDYCLKNYRQAFKDKNTESGPFWEAAEVFNAVLQSTAVFRRLHGSIKSIGYPNLKSKLSKARKIWNGDIDDWIIKFAITKKN